ncbi:MAG: HD-GYP domain-containing protein [Lachnospiraceae bacterium]|nr:HD-GYP domain-containing protein [Lachnospiraceae bacterium]
MRYLPMNQIKKDMILGQELYDGRGNLLLPKYTKLTDDHISYIIFQGITGLYIDDSFSRDVEVREVLEPEVRRDTLRMINHLFQRALEGQCLTEPEEDELRCKVECVVNQVLDEQDVLYNLLDLKTYDDYTYCHSTDVAVVAGVLGAKCGLGDQQLHELVTAGFLHDIGKVYVNAEIINAPRRLTETERAQVMDHPRLGYEYLKENYHFSDAVTQCVYEHHEWYNGGGYPCRKKDKDISFLARILKVADVFDAMTSNRSYHAPYLPSEVMEYIMARSGMEFDPDVVTVATRELSIYPVGCEVELSTGAHALVIRNHRGYTLRPTIKHLETGEIIDLSDNRKSWNITITKLLM